MVVAATFCVAQELRAKAECGVGALDECLIPGLFCRPQHPFQGKDVAFSDQLLHRYRVIVTGECFQRCLIRRNIVCGLDGPEEYGKGPCVIYLF